MRILLDTNILISTALFPDGVAARAYALALKTGHVMVAEYSLDEMRTVAARKFPHHIAVIDVFIEAIVQNMQIVKHDRTNTTDDQIAIRDPKDWPIWQAARISKADILLTGDKDFLESGLEHPVIVSPADYLACNLREE